MKTHKLFISLLSIALALNTAHAQLDKKTNNQKNTKVSSDDSKCFDGTTKILNLGVGFRGFNYYRAYKGSGWSYHATPAISLSYEQALSNKIGPGYVGVGGYFGFQTSNAQFDDSYYYNGAYGNYYYKYRWSNIMVGARAAYHMDDLVAIFGELGYGISYLTLGLSYKL